MENNTRRKVLEEAVKCVCKDREGQYGSPENSFNEIAKLWTVWLGIRVTPRDVAVMMTMLKIARIKTGHFKEDSYIDACGYLACAAEIQALETDQKNHLPFVNK